MPLYNFLPPDAQIGNGASHLSLDPFPIGVRVTPWVGLHPLHQC